MKLSEALLLQEGDLVDVRSPGWQGGRACWCKVLVVSSKGGVYVREPSAHGRWVQYHHVVALARHEELTETERAHQRYEVERFQANRERLRQKERQWWLRYVRQLRPQKLYQFVWDELEDGEARALEALQATANARGLQADATTWRRIGRVLGCNKDSHFWRLPSQDDGSVVVMPISASSAPEPDRRGAHDPRPRNEPAARASSPASPVLPAG